LQVTACVESENSIFILTTVIIKEIIMILYEDTPFHIGTAGYKFDDWTGNFYPRGTQNENMLGYYSKDKGIKFLELTFTFYTDPTEEITKNIAENSAEDLEFSVRLPKRFLKNPSSFFDASRFKNGLDPIYPRVKAYFADFFYAFAPSRANLDHIAALRDRFSDKPFFVELANRRWYKEKYIQEIKNLGVGMVVCDYPSSSGLAPYMVNSFERNAYFRLYGNSPKWISHDTRDLEYNYKKDELEKIIKDASALSAISDNVFISFCNSSKGCAPKNAIDLRKMLESKKHG